MKVLVFLLMTSVAAAGTLASSCIVSGETSRCSESSASTVATLDPRGGSHCLAFVAMTEEEPLDLRLWSSLISPAIPLDCTQPGFLLFFR